MRSTRTATELREQAMHAAVDALVRADIGAEVAGPSALRIDVDGVIHELRVEAVGYATGGRARQVLGRAPDDLVLLVADRITTEAAEILTDAGWSWLDLRGRLHVRAPGIRVDIDVPPGHRTGTVAGPAITGRSGLEVAYWLCSNPGRSLSPTRDAAALGLAPSTVSTAVRRLAEAGLVDDDGAGVFPELFFELSASWRVERTWLAAVPDLARGVPVDVGSPGWRRTGDAVAAAYGAPMVVAAGGPVELYVASAVEVTIAARQYGVARAGLGAASVMVAPVSAVVAPLAEAEQARPSLDGWPAAPLLAVALELAQDRSRGREVLESWEVSDAVWR